MNLTPHFTLEELTDSDTAVRLGINNAPPPEVVPHLMVLAEGLELVRSLLGDAAIHVDSGYRCEALERVLTEKDFGAWCVHHGKDPAKAWPEYFAGKAHPKGYAGDLKSAIYGPPRFIVKAIARSAIRFDQLITEGSWVHISFDPAMRGNVLDAAFANGVPTYRSL